MLNTALVFGVGSPSSSRKNSPLKTRTSPFWVTESTILFLLVFLVSEHAIWEWNRQEWEQPDVYIHAGINAVIALAVCLAVFFMRRWFGFYRHSHTVFLCLSIFISVIISVYALSIGHTVGVPWDESTAQKVRIINENFQVQ